MHEGLRRYALRLQSGAYVIVLALLLEAATPAVCSLGPPAADFDKCGKDLFYMPRSDV